MSKEEDLKVYIVKLQELALERLNERELTPLEALKEALHFIEGEMQER